ncbi:MAG: rRNA pseudouridine synthase [Treponemataceae bacterium]|nr:rRNA pseudouridine synthase [Treponemataceae bacterium]
MGQPFYTILQSQGFGSRKECLRMIRHGRCAIEGTVITDPEAFFDLPEGTLLTVHGVSWPYVQRLYVALNKPVGYECSRAPTHHESVFELLPSHFIRRGVQPVGRLDWDSEGLLLFSDDGPFIHALTSPKKHIPKTYLVTTKAPCTKGMVRALLQGVLLKGETELCRALSCTICGDFQLELVIDEGRYHQVKRMVAAVGNHCVGLKRVRIGGLSLEMLGLSEGQWAYLKAEDLLALRYEK